MVSLGLPKDLGARYDFCSSRRRHSRRRRRGRLSPRRAHRTRAARLDETRRRRGCALPDERLCHRNGPLAQWDSKLMLSSANGAAEGFGTLIGTAIAAAVYLVLALA